MAKASSQQVPGKSKYLLQLFELLDEAKRRNEQEFGLFDVAALAEDAQVSIKTVKGYFATDRDIRTRPQQWQKLADVLGKVPYFAKRHQNVEASGLWDRIKLAWEQTAPTAYGRRDPTVSRTRDSATLPPLDAPLDAPARAVLASALRRPVNGVPGFVMQRYATLHLARIGAEEDDLYANFVPVKLQPWGREPQGGRPDRFDRMVDLLADADHSGRGGCIWLLRGEPGAGKSTVLMDLELCRAHAACEVWRQQPEARPEVCVRVSLARMPSPTAPSDIDDWIQSKWQALAGPPRDDGGATPSLAELHRGANVRYLLDGLNEVQVGPGMRRGVINTFAQWSSGQLAAHRPGPVFTVRRLNYVSFPEGPQYAIACVVDLEPWTEDHMRNYCALRLPEVGNPLWRAIDEHPQKQALAQLFGNPFNLALQCALFKRRSGRSTTVAQTRSQLMGRIGLLRLAAALQREEPALAAAGLVDASDCMGDEERIAATADHGGAWHEVPLRGRLLPILEAVAFAGHARMRGAWARWAEDETVDGLAPADWAPALKAAASMQVATLAAGIHVETRTLEWQFSHQLWQEYLAAAAMARDAATWGQTALVAPDSRPDPSGWELPLPEPVFWDQAVQLAVEMAAPATAHRMLERLLAENTALAARSVLVRGADGVADELLFRIKAALLERTRSITLARPEVRIEAGLLLGSLNDDIRYEERRSSAGTEYRIPKSSGWTAIASARHEACMAFAPVTNAEFGQFLRAGGYGGFEDSEPPPWWEGEQSIRWWRGEVENESRRVWWNLLREQWGGPGWNAIRVSQLSNWRQEDIDRVIEPMMRRKLSEFQVAVDQICAPRRFRRPDAWNVPRLRNPLQPVVGVCYWEATAYCRWVSLTAAALGWHYRLPSQAEWEAVARSAGVGIQRDDATATMHGDRNHLLLRSRCPTPVGAFPATNTPDGVADMLGQVWEWTCDTQADEGVARGGSWDCLPHECVADSRKAFALGDREDDLGFRLVYSPLCPGEPGGRGSR